MSLKFSDLPSHDQMVKHILTSYGKATDAEKEEGMNWYPLAKAECECIADNTGGWYDLEQIIGIMAVGSPGVNWRENFTIPERMVDLHMRGIPATEWEGFTCYKRNLYKCEAVLHGDYSAIKGRKTVAFFSNIAGDSRVVTVDRWAVRVIFNDPHIPATMIAPSTSKCYNAIADAYIEAAELVGIEPSEMQAICWTQLRNQFGGKIKAMRKKGVVEVG